MNFYCKVVNTSFSLCDFDILPDNMFNSKAIFGETNSKTSTLSLRFKISIRVSMLVLQWQYRNLKQWITIEKSSSDSMLNEKRLKRNSKDKEKIKCENSSNESINSRRLWSEHKVQFIEHLFMGVKENAENLPRAGLVSLEVFPIEVNLSNLARKGQAFAIKMHHLRKARFQRPQWNFWPDH